MPDPNTVLRRWADQRPEALQDLVDPTLTLANGVEVRTAWALPTGWVRIVNRLHRDLVELLGGVLPGRRHAEVWPAPVHHRPLRLRW